MKIPFRLRRRPTSALAHALLLEGQDVQALLSLCARAGVRSPYRIHRVAGGFLLKLDAPSSITFAGATRLRLLAENLYVPADADLTPTLLHDEASGLVSRTGLIFLPGGRIFSFAPDRPMPLSSLLGVKRIDRGDWQEFLTPPDGVDRIHSIRLELPDDNPEAILQAGGEDIGTEAPRPEDSSMPSKLLGKTALGAGKAMMKLGEMFGMQGVAKLGAKWVAAAMKMAPRLSESLLGRQEAALRALLREFREGNLERALRRALPIGGEGSRGGTAHPNERLPTHSLSYSLSSLLGGQGVAPSIWLGGAEVHRELEKEYRRVADEAIARGDFRRAAFIHARLLFDFRRAADILNQGGLHHDAAILYLNKVGDRSAAARAFEAAGEIDRALELYRQMGEHVEAGDLLKRAGDDEGAFLEYRQAALRMIERGDYVAAADLMLAKAARPDLARNYLEEGWKRRPAACAVPSVVRLARLLAEQAASLELRTLVAEARAFFDPVGNEHSAAQFYNAVAAHAEMKNLAEARDDLRDQAFVGLTIKLRQRVAVESKQGDLVSRFLGRAGVWPSAVVSDADFAVKNALKKPGRHRGSRTSTRQRIGDGKVTACCSAWLSGDVFIGFESGEVVCIRPDKSDQIVLPPPQPGIAVISLAVDKLGKVLVVLRRDPERTEMLRLEDYRRAPDGSWTFVISHSFPGDADETVLAPSILVDHEGFLLCILDAMGLRVTRRLYHDLYALAETSEVSELTGAFLIQWPREMPRKFSLLVFESSQMRMYPDLGSKDYKTPIMLGSQPMPVLLGWTPSDSSPPSWFQDASEMELAGLNQDRLVCWSRFHHKPPGLLSASVGLTSKKENYLTTTIIRPGFLAGVRATGIDWLRAGKKSLEVREATPLSLPNAIACFVSHPTNELLVICRDGDIERVPLPIG